MLDEPFAGIDPKTVNEIQDSIRELAVRFNLGILLTDHNFRETIEVTDRSYLIREGRVFAYGTPDKILLNRDARRYYLGERFDAGALLDQIQRRGLHHAEPGHDPNEVVIDPFDVDTRPAGDGLPPPA